MGGGTHPVATGLRARAAAVLLAERLLRAAFPAAGVLGAYLVLGVYGFGAPALFAACLVFGFLLLAAGLRQVRRPRARDVEARIEAASGLAHRPFAALADQPETDDPASLALWRAHRARAEAALAAARAGWPAPAAAARDPFALRALLLLLLLTGLIAAGPDAATRLAAALVLPEWTIPAPRVDVWITAPDYANIPPLLAPTGGGFSTLAGSRVSVLVNGPDHPPAIHLPGGRVTASRLAATSFRADATLATSGWLTVGPWWHRLGAWRITVTPPRPPVLRLRGISFTADGRLRLLWTVADPYGLASLSARLTTRGAPAAAPLVLALPTGTGDADATLDLAGDPLAGLPAALDFLARNRAGVRAAFIPGIVVTPPIPAYADATAAALFLARRQLALDPRHLAPVAATLATLAAAPPSDIADDVDVQLAALAAALSSGDSSAATAVHRLGLLIQEIMDRPDAAAAALQQANQALLNTLRNGLTGAPATSATLQNLLRTIEAALAQRLAAHMPAAGPTGQKLDLSALEQLAARIAAEEAAGQEQAAAQDLTLLQNMLDQLQTARPMTAADAARARAAAAAAAALANATAAEMSLRDATSLGAGTTVQQTAIAKSLAAARRAAAQAGLKLPGLDPATLAMAQAEAALGGGRRDDAQDAETAAIQALQKTAAALAAATPPILSLSGGSAGAGRSEGANGQSDEAPGFRFPGANPADAIEQEILREDAAPSLPPATRQYLRRLLTPQP